MTGEYGVNRRIEGGEVIHDAVVMGKVCHPIVDDVEDDNVFWEEIGKEKYRE